MMKTGARTIPDKLYFRIGEVSNIVSVKPYVLRYWESEFSDIKPSKSKSGQRLYKRRDVELLLMVKSLLYDERFTIDGARQRLKDMVKEGKIGAKLSDEGVKIAHTDEPTTKSGSSTDEAGQMSFLDSKVPETSEATSKVLKKLKGDLESCLSDLS